MNRLTLLLACWLWAAAALACSSTDSSGGAGTGVGGGGEAGTSGVGGAGGAGGTLAAGGTGGTQVGGSGGSLLEGGSDADAVEDANADSQEAGTKLLATIETSKGRIVVELNLEKSPITVENFKKYADDGFYDGLIFHRVIKDFMIQGGGVDQDMNQKWGTYDPIINEAKASGLKNVAGAIAMARTTDPDSATCQFFINTVDNPQLDPGTKDPNGYAVFGMVVEGMDVVHTIEGVETGTVSMWKDAPLENVVISSLKVEKK